MAVFATSGDLQVRDAATATIGAAELAEKTERYALDRGFDLEVDCGEEDVPLVAGTSILCSAQYRVEGTTSVLTVTIATATESDVTLTVVGFNDPKESTSF